MKTPFESYKEDWILLTESAFIAVNQADEVSAINLIKAAKLFNKEATLPDVALGYLHLHKLELKQAVDVFEEVIKKEPENETAKALLGICLGLMPNGSLKGEKILDETLKTSKDPMIKELSNTAIHFIDRFVKKSPGPAGK